MEKYFDIHISYDREGYSIFVKATDESGAIDYAVENHLFTEEGDEKYIDYVEEITKAEYEEWK